jgi:hypothetical protein
MVRLRVITMAAGLMVAGAQQQQLLALNDRPTLQGCGGESKPWYEITSYRNPVGKSETVFEVKLLNIPNSGKDKPGKKITAVVTDDGALVGNTVVRHNTKIVGHVAEVQKRDKLIPRRVSSLSLTASS